MSGLARRILSNGVLSSVEAQDIPQPGTGEVLLRIHATSVNYHDWVGVQGGSGAADAARAFFRRLRNHRRAGRGRHCLGGRRPRPAELLPELAKRPADARQAASDPGRRDRRDAAEPCLRRRPFARRRARASFRRGSRHAGLRGADRVAQRRGGGGDPAGTDGGAAGNRRRFAVRARLCEDARRAGDRHLVFGCQARARARALGADVAINYRVTPDWAKAVLAETDGQGADLVVEVGGGETLGEAVRASRTGGHVSVIGVLTGLRAPDFPLNIVMSRNLTVRGITVGSIADLDAMCRAIALSGYRPVIDSRFELATAHDALAALKAQRHFGKIVVGID